MTKIPHTFANLLVSLLCFWASLPIEVASQSLDCSNVLYPTCHVESDGVTTMNNRKVCGASDPTSCDQLGPFYMDMTKLAFAERAVLLPESWFAGRTKDAPIESCSGASTAVCGAFPARLLLLSGKVLSLERRASGEVVTTPLPNVTVDIWSAGEHAIAGKYHNGGYSWVDRSSEIASTKVAEPLSADDDLFNNFWFRGYQQTDENGEFGFLTQFPVIYGARPVRHVHMTIYHIKEGNKREPLLTTQVYFGNLVPAWNSLANHVNQVVEWRTLSEEKENGWSESGESMNAGITFIREQVDAGNADECFLEDCTIVANFEVRLERSPDDLMTGLVNEGNQENNPISSSQVSDTPLHLISAWIVSFVLLVCYSLAIF